MSRALEKFTLFNNGKNKITQAEATHLPDKFTGSSKFDFVIFDTDDSFTVPEDLLRGKKRGWKVVSPINPFDPVGLQRIPKEIGAVVKASFLSPNQINLSIVANMVYGGDHKEGYMLLKEKLDEQGILSLLISSILPHAQISDIPPIIEEDSYINSIKSLLQEIAI